MDNKTKLLIITLISYFVYLIISVFASIDANKKFDLQVDKYNDLKAGLNEYKKDISIIQNSTVKLVYCEDLNNLFVGTNDIEINKYVLKRYGAIFDNKTENYVLNHALYCDMNNTTCQRYKYNDWIVARTICKNFNFKIIDLFN